MEQAVSGFLFQVRIQKISDERLDLLSTMMTAVKEHSLQRLEWRFDLNPGIPVILGIMVLQFLESNLYPPDRKKAV